MIGNALVSRGLRNIFQEIYFQEYIQTRQLASRLLYGSWSSLSTRLAGAQWKLSPSSYRRTAMAQRYAWDKLTHPAHPSLEHPLDCPHCKVPSGMEHIVMHCKHKDILTARTQVNLSIGSLLQEMHYYPDRQSMCMILEEASRNHKYALRIWTGLWNAELLHDISSLLGDMHMNKNILRANRKHILDFLSIFSQGLIYIWRAWKTFVLPNSTSLLEKFPRLHPPSTRQLTIRAFIPRAASQKEQIRKDVNKAAGARMVSTVQPSLPKLLPAWSTGVSLPAPSDSRQQPVMGAINDPSLGKSQDRSASRPAALRGTGLTRWLSKPKPNNTAEHTESNTTLPSSLAILPTYLMHVNCILHDNAVSPRAGIG